MESFTLEDGKENKMVQAKRQAMVLRSSLKSTFTKVSLWTAKNTEQELWKQRMEMYMTVNGLKESNMVKEFTTMLLLKLSIKVNGKTVRKMVLAFSNSPKSNIIKEPLSSLLKTDMELKCLLTETSTKDNTGKESSTVKVNTHGLTHLFLKVTFMKEWDMEMGVGSHRKSMETSMSELIKTTRRVVTDDTFGPMDAFMRETSQKTSSKYIFYFRHGKGRLIYTDGK